MIEDKSARQPALERTSKPADHGRPWPRAVAHPSKRRSTPGLHCQRKRPGECRRDGPPEPHEEISRGAIRKNAAKASPELLRGTVAFAIGADSSRLGPGRRLSLSGTTPSTSNRPTTPSSRRGSPPSRQRSSGYITAVPVTDNQHVAAGDVIARIDDRDYRIALDQARGASGGAQASIENIDAQINVQQAQISANEAQVEQAQAALVFAQQQAARYQDLAQKGSGTVQNAQQYSSQLRQQQAALASAQATLKLAQRQIEALKAQRNSAVASLAQAKAQRDQAQLNLSYTTVTAAQPGRVVNLSAAVGQFAQPGTNLTMFVPDQIWVTANFKETQLDAHAARPAGDARDRRLSGTHHPRPCRQRPARIRHGVLAAAGAERHRQLRQDRPARAGQDRHGRSADRRRARPGHVGGPDRADRSDAVALMSG